MSKPIKFDTFEEDGNSYIDLYPLLECTKNEIPAVVPGLLGRFDHEMLTSSIIYFLRKNPQEYKNQLKKLIDLGLKVNREVFFRPFLEIMISGEGDKQIKFQRAMVGVQKMFKLSQQEKEILADFMIGNNVYTVLAIDILDMEQSLKVQKSLEEYLQTHDFDMSICRLLYGKTQITLDLAATLKQKFYSNKAEKEAEIEEKYLQNKNDQDLLNLCLLHSRFSYEILLEKMSASHKPIEVMKIRGMLKTYYPDLVSGVGDNFSFSPFRDIDDNSAESNDIKISLTEIKTKEQTEDNSKQPQAIETSSTYNVDSSTIIITNPILSDLNNKIRELENEIRNIS